MAHQQHVIIGSSVPPVGSPTGTSIGVAVVVIGGGGLHPTAVAAVPPGAFVIAADSGLDHALAAGLRPDLVVGDLDSVSADGLAWARSNGIPIRHYPQDKNSTDTEIALAAAIAMGATDVVLLGGGGDRLDHSIAAITALGHPSLLACRSVSAVWGDSLVNVLHGPRRQALDLATGATFSVLALHGACAGVGIIGAEWPLDDAVIEPGSSRGVSNICVADPVTVCVASGVLTVVVPDHLATIAGQR